MADLDELINARREKLRRLKERGIDAYPHKYPYTHRLGEIISLHGDLPAAGESAEAVAVAGRIISWRDHGKSAFCHLEDATGRLQVYLKKDILGEAAFAGLSDLDVGDFAGVGGCIMRTRTGELTVKAASVTLLAKSLRPPPEKWHGLKDTDIRYRARHIDLASSEKVREIFRVRASAISLIRRYLDGKGYLEVETPVLQPLYGGAEATPFTTFYESLKTTYYLRISNELYLKRLLAGGLDRVYEFSKDFRNEGLDRMHTPEFTLLELYEAYADYTDMMLRTEEIFRAVVTGIKGSPELVYQERKMDFGAPWPRIEFVPALAGKLGFDPLAASTGDLRRAAENARIPGSDKFTRPKLMDKLFSELVQPDLKGPVFVVNHPIELTPLAKAHRSDSRLAERFEPILAGSELGNAFSELNDPGEQLKRFTAQQALKAEGDDETQQMDTDFLGVLEQGMPPAGGLGIGIDRMIMILCDVTSIRETILFPQLKPEKGE
jgi:lysyl-tRNA synthetase class 2